MEALREYLNSLSSADQASFAAACGTTIGYLRKAISTKQALSPVVCSLAERHSHGAARRWDLRPEDWHLIWPELVGADGAPPVAAVKAA